MKKMSEDRTKSAFDVLDQIDTWGLKFHTFFTALELDLFTIIHSGHHSINQIVRSTQSSIRGVKAILEDLCTIGLLNKHHFQYWLSPTAEAFLVRGSPTCCVDFYLAHWPSRTHLTESVRYRKPMINVRLADFEQMWADYTAIDLVDWQQRASTARERWRELGLTYTANLRILDAACGSGIYSFVCAQDDPTVRVTCLDLPKVLQVAAKLTEKMDIADQIDYLPGDLLKVDFPHQYFDVVWYGAILYYFTPQELDSLLHKTYKCLKPRGKIVIRSLAAGEDEVLDEFALLLQVEMVHLTEHSYVYAFPEYKKILKKTGFREVTPHSNVLISAIKSKTDR